MENDEKLGNTDASKMDTDTGQVVEESQDDRALIVQEQDEIQRIFLLAAGVHCTVAIVGIVLLAALGTVPYVNSTEQMLGKLRMFSNGAVKSHVLFAINEDQRTFYCLFGSDGYRDEIFCSNFLRAFEIFT